MASSDPVRIVSKNNTVANLTGDGELWITETEKENDVWVNFTGTFNATTYAILVSKNNPVFPHKIQKQNGNRIDITAMYYSIDLAANTEGKIRIGVITRIDGTNSDIKYLFEVSFLAGASKVVLTDTLKASPSQVKLDFNNNGVLQHGLTNNLETNITAVKIGTNLSSPDGSISPGLGDIIIKYEHTSGSVNASLFMFYHNTD